MSKTSSESQGAEPPEASEKPDGTAAATDGQSAKSSSPKARASWPLRMAWAGGAVISILAFLALGLVLTLNRAPQTAPEWLAMRVATMISESSDQQVSFDGMAIGLSDQLAPQVYLRALSVRDAAGEELFAANAVRATADLGSLLAGDIALREVTLSDIGISVTRSSTGLLDLDLARSETEPSQGAAAQPVSALIDQIDRRLEQAPFASLESVRAQNVRISYTDLAAGRTWSVDGGRITLEQDETRLSISSDMAILHGGGDLATLTLDLDRDRTTLATTLGAKVDDMPAGDLATVSPSLAWMEVIEAPIDGAFRMAVLDNALGPLSATLAIGAGVLAPTDGTRPIRFDGAQTYFNYRPAERRITFDLIELESSLGNLTADGFTRIVGDDASPDFITQLEFERFEPSLDGRFGLSAMSFGALPGTTAEFRVRLDPFQVDLGHVALPLGPTDVRATGQVKGLDAGWDVALDFRVADIDAPTVLGRWPEELLPKVRPWFLENLSTARVTGGHFAVRSTAERPEPVLAGSFSFDDLGLRYLRHLPPIEAGRGIGTINGSELVLALESGHLTAPQGGRIAAAGTSMIFEDLTQRPIMATLDLDGRGTLTALLATVDQRPFEFLSKANRPVTLGDGQAALGGKIRFPIKRRVRPDEVDFDLAGSVRNFSSSQVVRGQTLRAAEARVDITPTALTVSGPMSVSGVAVDGAWSLPLGPERANGSRFVGEVEISPRALDTFDIALPPGTLSRQARGTLELAMPVGVPPRFTLRSDLAGAGVAIPALDWAKPPSAAMEFEARGQLGDNPSIGLVRLQGAGLLVEGSLSTRDGGLERAILDRVQSGSWIDAEMELRGRGAGQPVEVLLGGGSIDMRSAPKGRPGGAKPTPVALRLDQLRVSDTITLTDFVGDVVTGDGLRGSFTARVNGAAQVQGVLVPGPNGTRIKLTSDDAGGVMAAAGILRNARGGQMVLDLVPTGRDGVLNGSLSATNARLADAPTMATLLSAVSVVGLLEQLDGQGLLFTDVSAEFQLTPEELILASSSAVGPSLGISLDGRYRLAEAEMDMQGVISPFYIVNGLGAIFTRRGEGLFGMNFTMTGPARQPRVAVNPLSVLTPGMFREIFRRAPPDISQ